MLYRESIASTIELHRRSDRSIVMCLERITHLYKRVRFDKCGI